VNLPLLIILALLAYGFWGMQRTPEKPSGTAREKALAIRGIAMLVVLAVVFVGALLFLPNKARVLMMLPAFFVAVTVGKAWRDSRRRLRRAEQERVDLEKMKRIN
jgi:fatty acid desaturase